MNSRPKPKPMVTLCLVLQAAAMLAVSPCIAAPISGATAATASTASSVAGSPPTAVAASASSQTIYTDAQAAILAGESVGRAADRLARQGNISKPLPDQFRGGFVAPSGSRSAP